MKYLLFSFLPVPSTWYAIMDSNPTLDPVPCFLMGCFVWVLCIIGAVIAKRLQPSDSERTEWIREYIEDK